MDETTHASRKRLLFRANHRGTRENDLLIGGFVASALPGMDGEAVAAMEAVLDIPDPVIGDFLTGRGPMPVGYDRALLTDLWGAGRF